MNQPNPLQSDLPDCKTLTADLGLYMFLFIYLSFHATCLHSDKCTDFLFFSDTTTHCLDFSPRQIVFGLRWQCLGFWGSLVGL